MRDFHLPGRSTAHSLDGMCATSSPLASLAALDVLKAGGNAVDAAVTASAVMCVTEPHMTGIGGDCFVLLGRPDGSVTGLNGSGRAPLAADADWLKQSGLNAIGPESVHSVTVPGAVDAWDRLLADHGTITLAEALAPAIALAERGVPVSPRVAHDWAMLVEKLAADEGGRTHYLIDGRAPRVGEVHAVPALARSLRAIAREGRGAFYEGEIAEDIVAHLAARGGLLTMEDFARTQATWVEPVSTTYNGHEILELPPNGQGVTALIALNVLKRFDMAALDPLSVERFHLQVEATRLAYAVRDRHVADPEAADVPLGYMLSDDLARNLAASIDPDRAMADAGAAVGPPPSHTVYLSVVDRDRLAVSFINSVYWSFGSGIVTPGTGIVLHNRGSGFVTDPGHRNCIAPGKRPFHTIIPAMVRKGGRVMMPFGVMGAAYQPMGHVHVLLNMLDYGMDIQEALDLPRLFYRDGVLGLERGMPEAVAEGLVRLGHEAARLPEPLGGGQGIVIDRDNGGLIGGSDPRKDGIALGY